MKLIKTIIFLMIAGIVTAQDWSAFEVAKHLDEISHIDTTDIVKLNLKNSSHGSIENLANDLRPFITKDWYERIVADRSDPDKSLQNFNLAFQGNPYIMFIEGTGALSTTLSKRDISSSFSGVNLSNLADGLAKFLVKRAKEELNIAFFEKFKKEMENQEELRALFPATYRTLIILDTEIYMFNSYITTLREAFQKDLSDIFLNLPGFYNTNTIGKVLSDNPQLNGILLSATYIMHKIQTKEHPGDIIAGFDTNYAAMVGDENTVAAIETIKLLSESLKSNDSNNYWVDISEVLSVFKDNDEKLTYTYLGLLYQKAKTENIQFQGSIPLTSILGDLKANTSALFDFKYQVEKITVHANKVDQLLQYLKKDENKNDLDAYHQLFTNMLDILDSATAFEPIINSLAGITLNYADDIHRITNAGKDISGVYINIQDGNYASAVASFVGLYDEIFGNTKAIENQIEFIDERIKSAGENEKGSLKEEKKVLKNRIKLKQQILKYGTFMANVALAKNSDEVAAVIEAAALPAGSSREKKHSKFNVAIQSGLGVNMLDIPDYSNYFRANGKYGFYAPVGVSFNIGIAKNSENAFSFGVMAQLFDIGSLAQYRLNDDSSELESKITLGNIWSPGVNIMIGLPKVPIAVGAGYVSKSPLIGVTNGSSVVSRPDNPTWGWHGFIMVDIPLFNVR